MVAITAVVYKMPRSSIVSALLQSPSNWISIELERGWAHRLPSLKRMNQE
jgi:hypothetical protein